MKRYRLALVGLGNVSRNLIRILLERGSSLEEKHEVCFSIVAISEKMGAVIASDKEHGLNSEELARILSDPDKLTTIRGYIDGCKAIEMIPKCGADILIELTPTDIQTGEPALSHMLQAFACQMHVVTANKGPLITAWQELKQAAYNSKRQLKFGCATAAALPTTNVGYYDLAGSEILSLEGVLNGTSNYLLTRMQEDGLAYEKALIEAQQMGIAEKDPSLDVNGYDTAVKLVILANELLSLNVKLQDVPIEGISLLSEIAIKEAKALGKVYKLVGSAKKDPMDGSYSLEVGLKLLDVDHPLASVRGTAKALTFKTDLLGTFFISGGNSDPKAAAAAILRDLINLVREE